MNKYALCGLDCYACDFKKEGKCKGCREMKGNSIFGDCKWYHCCTDKGFEHCGICDNFPCDELHNALEMVNGLSAIDNLKNL